MKIKSIIFISLFISILLPFFTFNSFSKYLFENTFPVAKVQIDNSPPEIELISFSNSNIPYPGYANNTHTITAKVRVIEDHIKNVNFDSSHIKFKVGNNFVSVKFKKISYTSPNSKERIYEIVFTDVPNDGNLSLYFLENSVINESSQSNSPKTFSSNILIDNTAPVATFSEKVLENGYSKAIVSVNEGIQPVSGWNITDDNKTLSFDFPNPIEFNLPIKDFAQNPGSALISIKKATNINLEYGIYDGGNNNAYVVNSGNISGENLISSNSIYKAEALFVRSSGNINTSFITGNAFLYTYSGEGSIGNCKYSELKYNYGFNPQSGSRVINKENWTNLFGKVYTEFGGTGINHFDSAGNILPAEIEKQYLYGLSGVSFSLVNYSQYSIVYQIYVKEIGWLPVKYNGQETMYSFDKPFCAIRINLVPNSQRQYLIDYWNKDC